MKSNDSFDETSSLNLLNNELIQEVQFIKNHNENNRKSFSKKTAKLNQIVNV